MLHLLPRVLASAHLRQRSSQQVVRRGIGRIQRHCSLEGTFTCFRRSFGEQGLTKIIGCVGIARIELCGTFQMRKSGLGVSRFEQRAPQLVLYFGVVPCSHYFFFVLADCLLILTQTGIGETQMVMSQRSVRSQTQNCLELIYRFESAVAVLIGAAQQQVSHRVVCMNFLCCFQLRGCRRILSLGQEYQGDIVVNAEVIRFETLALMKCQQPTSTLVPYTTLL